MRLITAVLAVVALMAPLEAQITTITSSRTAEMSREQLLRVQQQLEDAAASPGYSQQLRQRALREVQFIQERLDQGDFQVGDRIVLRVQGGISMSDTLSVQPGRVITLRDIGEIPLEGVLRSELQEHLEGQLSQFVQAPVVRAQSLIRIAVLGAVTAQGFYAIPADALIEDALMIAGGPAAEADIDGAEIRRGGQVLLGNESFQQAIVNGQTLDQLNLRAGDRIVVPERPAGLFSDGIVRGLLVVLPTITIVLTRLF